MTTKKKATKKKTAKKTAKKKTAKKAAAKTSRQKPRRKAVKKIARKRTAARERFDAEFPPLKDFENSPNAPMPWPLRPMQQQAHDAMKGGIDRLGLFWHRRAGKDVFGMSIAREQMTTRVGSYVHFFPKHVHAKRALWRGIDPRKGQKFIDIAFGDIEVARNNQDMLVEAFNGSTWTLLGSDNYDSSVIGANVVGVVFSEWALCDPRAWDYIRPILRENNGWAMFITTFRGRNHAWQMAQHLKDNPEWYIDIRTIEDTCELDGSRIISDADVEKDRREGMKESLIQQEYYCNPEATSDGAIYGRQVEALRKDASRQVTSWNPDKPVYCVWNFDLPVFAAYSMIQPGENPRVLEAGVLEFKTLGECLAKANQARWPIMSHLIAAEQSDMAAGFHDLDLNPVTVIGNNELMTTTRTANVIERMSVDLTKAEILVDSLGGYVRAERFLAQSSDLQFSSEPVLSWHWRLSRTLETFAIWEYCSADTWGQAPDYSQQDRAARILL